MLPDLANEDDTTLLREYCADRAEPAFRALVERHLPAVWSAARRIMNGDGALAEDIAQEVFAHLARHAPALPPRVVLGGWLHRHTCYTAAKAARGASRRRAREQQAAAMTASDPDPWPDIAPHLDAALNALSSADRDAVVLRFFEKRDFRAIATALGTSEDAARMRTARALDKLRGILGKRSALLTAAALTALLSEKSIAAPPVQMALRIAGNSLARAAAVTSVSGLAALLAALRRMRTALIAGSVLCVAGFAVWQWHDWLNHPDKSPRPPTAVSSGKGRTAPGPIVSQQEMEVTVHFILVPEAEAAALLADRWNSDGDSNLLAALLQKAGTNPDGVQLARKLTGLCASGTRVKLERLKEFPYPSDFEHGEKGMITPRDLSTRNIGSTAEVELVVPDDGELCDVNLSAEHHYAEPEMHHWATSLAEPENKDLPGAKQPEFRTTNVNAQIFIKPGRSGLVQFTQLPRPRDTPAETPEQRVFVFITFQPVTRS